MLQELVGKIAGLLTLVGFYYYVSNTFRRGHKPNRASWFIWTLSSFMLLVSFRALGSRYTFWIAVSGVIGPFITAIISLRNNDGKRWEPLEIACLIAALGSAIIWYFTNQPVTALLINLVVDFFGVFPTWKQIWHCPENEDVRAWTIWEVGNILNMFAIDNTAWYLLVYPIYFLVGTGISALVLFARLRMRKMVNA